MEKLRILIVDDEPNNISVLSELLISDYELMVALNGKKALELAGGDRQPDLILLDIMMPEMNGLEVCQKLKADPVTASIPVIFITAKVDIKDEAHGLSVGAVDYITKPISPPIVKARVATHLALFRQQKACEIRVQQQTEEIRRSQEDAVYMLGHAGHTNDDDTGMHIWRMAEFSKVLARQAGWNVDKQKMLQLAASMHDTGKIGIPDSILKKPGELDADEWRIMQNHSKMGYEILSIAKSPLFLMASEIALHHHEKWDGSGYPDGLAGEDIPESARIVAIADVFDALTTKRPYKAPWRIAKALDYIMDSDGHFDPKLSELFVSIEDQLVEIMEYWSEKGDSMML